MTGEQQSINRLTCKDAQRTWFVAAAARHRIRSHRERGFTNVLGWADPDRDISCAIMNNGKPLLSTRYLLWFDVMRVICTHVPRDRTLG